MSIIQKDYYYNNNLETNVWDNFWKDRPMLQNFQVNKLESTLQILFRSYISKGDKIIEAGCGLGQWVIFLKHYGYNIIGIDTNEFAISSIKEFNDSLQVELGEVLNIQYPNNSFDAYISIGVVEHFEEDPISALKEAYRVLNPNGLIFVSVPTINIIRKLIKRPIRKTIQSLWGKKKSSCIIYSN